jgi:hypothetical protein
MSVGFRPAPDAPRILVSSCVPATVPSVIQSALCPLESRPLKSASLPNTVMLVGFRPPGGCAWNDEAPNDRRRQHH